MANIQGTRAAGQSMPYINISDLDRITEFKANSSKLQLTGKHTNQAKTHYYFTEAILTALK